MRELTDLMTTLRLTDRAADWTSAGDLARRASTSPALLRELLDQLAALGLVDRDGPRYRIAPAQL